jgi:hypothetical protein
MIFIKNYTNLKIHILHDFYKTLKKCKINNVIEKMIKDINSFRIYIYKYWIYKYVCVNLPSYLV